MSDSRFLLKELSNHQSTAKLHAHTINTASDQFLDELPKDVLCEIGKYLSCIEKKRLAEMGSQLLFSVFNEFIKPASQDIRKFLRHVARGEQELAKSILHREPSLFLDKGMVTDYSGRVFKNISGFQYALWALDRHMWEMMLKCLFDTGHINKTRTTLFLQYEELEREGVRYELQGKQYKEQHYNFSPLISALKTYEANCYQWQKHQLATFWCEIVGGLQRYVPAHVAQHYCDPDTSFSPLPNFYNTNLKRCLSFRYGSYDYKYWFPLLPEMEAHFGMTRGDLSSFSAALEVGWFLHSSLDLRALTALAEVRTAEFKKLKASLLALTKEEKNSLQINARIGVNKI